MSVGSRLYVSEDFLCAKRSCGGRQSRGKSQKEEISIAAAGDERMQATLGAVGPDSEGVMAAAAGPETSAERLLLSSAAVTVSTGLSGNDALDRLESHFTGS
ncbi:uncharacterized protein V6R79_011759 [Siganus canaliculatus]